MAQVMVFAVPVCVCVFMFVLCRRIPSSGSVTQLHLQGLLMSRHVEGSGPEPRKVTIQSLLCL